MPQRTVRVAVNGYGVIGKRVADAIALTELERDPRASIAKTNSSLGISNRLLKQAGSIIAFS